MAKKKKAEQPIEEIKAKEVMVESVEEVKSDFEDEFVMTQLRVINRLPDRAKAKRLAERLLSNRRKG